MAKRNEFYKKNLDAIKVTKRNESLVDALYMNPMKLSDADARRVRRQLSKVANQRMVRLERTQSTVTGESFGEVGAISIVKQYLSEKGRTRFSETFGKDELNQVRKDIYALQTFIASPSSSVAELKKIEKKRIKAFESGQWGTGANRRKIASASYKSFYDFLNSKTYSDLKAKGLTSEQIIEIYDTMRESKSDKDVINELADAYDEFAKTNKEIPVKDFVKTLGLTEEILL